MHQTGLDQQLSPIRVQWAHNNTPPMVHNHIEAVQNYRHMASVKFHRFALVIRKLAVDSLGSSFGELPAKDIHT